jgi:hypothetical protein
MNERDGFRKGRPASGVTTKESSMGGDEKEDVNADSAEFKQGVEAGLNSAEDTKNWKAGNELGQELRAEGEAVAPVYARPDGE